MKKRRIIPCMAIMLLIFAGCGNAGQSSLSAASTQSAPSEAVQREIETESSVQEKEEMAEDDAQGTKQQAVGVFDLDRRTVLLNNGMEMPIIGLGTYGLSPEEAENSVYHALAAGYRLLDTANAYMNERAVGRGIRRAIDEGLVTREDIFLTTKLWVSEYETVESSIEETLARLDVDYIDLLLLHQPYGSYRTAYQDLEKAAESGKVRAIGLSNFYDDRYEEVLEAAVISPAVLQIETNPLNQQLDTKEILAERQVQLEAWSPLGGRGHTDELFGSEVLAEIAEAHDKSVVQVILRWHMQTGNVAIPGSRNPDHIRENIDIFDFALTDEEMERINGLDTGVGVYDFSWEAVADNDSFFESAEPMDFEAQE